jgi:Fe-S oxidoreductase
MLVPAFVFSLIVIAAVALFMWSTRTMLQPISQGKPDNRTNHIGTRLKRLLRWCLVPPNYYGHPFLRILRLLLLFVILIVCTAVGETFAEGITEEFFPFKFLGRAYRVITFLQEICCGAAICAVLVLLARQSAASIFRKRAAAGSATQRIYTLCMIALITASVLANNSVRIAEGAATAGLQYPLSSVLARYLSGAPSPTLTMHLVWGLNIVLVLLFINLLPFSNDIHILTSIPNIFFSKIEERGMLPPMHAGTGPHAERGAMDSSDLTWKQLLDGYACTECGDCDTVCPALRAGDPLSPQKIITDIRERTGECFRQKGHSQAKAVKMNDHRSILHGHIADEELWACTTCMACVDVCPVSIEHVEAIVGFRRGLVINERRIPHDVESLFTRLEEHGSPYTQSASARADWAQGLGIQTLADDPHHDVLFWVGCAGAFDARCRNISIAFARLMQHAGVRFAILGSEERCTGDAARRLGNEPLARALMRQNIDTFRRYKVKTIVTACPHCFNTLKNEYPQAGGMYTVLHHTEFLDSLLRAGRLTITHASTEPYTYHDPCYLSRGNGITEEPRKILGAICVARRTELSSSRDHTLCCGAGGGRMWMDGSAGTPINLALAQQVLDSKCETIATACPFCITSLTDGIHALDPSGQYIIRDIAEILSSAIDERLKVSPTLRS